ncbi:T9SS type A sorting domain-containing protein [Flavobacterium sp. xlx-214]|uniref:T9SS type A sorting domain-containing protein n=1 Tax=unclassified Flavobacterium TaxID=196869 RepID=UPI0013D6EEE9|nr:MULTISPECIES: T9SS type A sorting domain-containing protein [unclassified Flavobacterium]MBA5793541.1 T9SS type A sorting domain-containing protein [Flavobacterium sp. xlx-221]QMI82690.1 T9SS type A sorting domain-containing protein [Flavobacterium sp. xlx-214]
MNKKILFFLLISSLGFSQVQIGQDIEGEVANGECGHSVFFSANGKIIAIGEPLNSIGVGKNSGQVRVYQNKTGFWEPIGNRLFGDNIDDKCGYSVALSFDGSIIATGAIGVKTKLNGNDFNGAGQVRVYQNKNFSIFSAWNQIGQDIKGKIVKHQSLWVNESLGTSLALSNDGNVLAIGIPNGNGSNYGEGNVRIYQNISGVWVQQGIDINGEATNDRSGSENSISLSADGKVVAIGSKFNSTNGVNSGHVRIFKNVSGIWTQIGNDIEGVSNDLSGSSVSLSADGSIIAIGSPGNGSGHVRIFKNISGVWVQQGKDILGEDIGERSGFSISLSANGSVVAIGAPYNKDANGVASGHVRIYQNISGVWIQQGKDIKGEAEYDQFGHSISLSGDGKKIVIGAPGNDGFDNNSGHVRVYDLSGVLSNNEFVQQNFNIYPNPTSDILNIGLENNLVLEQVTVYNNLGQVVKTTSEDVIDVSQLAKGLYFVEVITNQGKATKKVVIK